MSVYYPTSCDEETPNHFCDLCADDEHGRVRSVALIKKDFEFVDPSNAQEWLDGINSGDIIIIPETNGSFDGGTPKEGPGYGDTLSTYLGSDFVLQFKDPNYKQNCVFYNAINKSRRYKVAYRTESLIHISDKTAFINAKPGVLDDLTSTVVWDVTTKWASSNIPCAYEMPDGVFTCFLQD